MSPQALRPPWRGGPLPIDDVTPTILSALKRSGTVVVKAPPGSGKTTRLPPALLDGGLLGTGTCLVLQPRRIAARAAARRVAEERGVRLGEEIGHEVRFDRKATSRTRILYVTEGILTARLQSDPFLEGVTAVILDEFHERSLEADLALAFTREIRASVRPDLRVAVFSATLDPGPVASYLDAEVVETAGRSHPVEVEYVQKVDRRPLPERMVAAVRRVWMARPAGVGDVLAFLPGAADIRRTCELLAPWAQELGVAVLPLHGDLPSGAQDAVLRAAPGHLGRIILATNVAETSVTVEGVTVVVDGGLAKVLRHDPATGLDRLEVAAISRDSADQRAGRAGRLGPGLAYRLWTRHEELSRPQRGTPEVLRVDVCRAALEILAWGSDPATFAWFERPADDRLGPAVALLNRLGALDGSGRLTPLGESLRRLPLHPRLGRMVIDAAHLGCGRTGASLAALLAERDLFLPARALLAGREGLFSPDSAPSPSDLLHRLELLKEAEAVGFEPGRVQSWGVDPAAARAVARARDQILALLPPSEDRDPSEAEILHLILSGFPDRVARRRAPTSNRYVLVGGKGAILSRHSSVTGAEFLVAVRLEAAPKVERSEAVIRWGSQIDIAWLGDLGGIESKTELSFDSERGRVTAIRGEYYADLCLRSGPVPPDPIEAARMLAREAARDPGTALRPGREVRAFVARCRFLCQTMPELGLPSWEPQEWVGVVEELAQGKSSLDELRKADLLSALRARLTRRQLQDLERHAPERIEVPSANRIAVRYPEVDADGTTPVLAVKIQEVFGWSQGPRVAGGRVPVLLHLLGPHGRPLQVTADLESFWQKTYPEIRKEMRGRYPKHRWPEDPYRAEPSRRTAVRRESGA